MPLLTAALVGMAVAAGAKAVGEAAGALTPAARDQRKLLKQEQARMEAGDLGLSEAEKNKLLTQTYLAGQNAAAQAEADAARREAAQGGSGQSRAATDARRMISEETRRSRADAGAAVMDASQQKALAEKAWITGALADRADRQRAAVSGIVGAGVEGAIGEVRGENASNIYDTAELWKLYEQQQKLKKHNVPTGLG